MNVDTGRCRIDLRSAAGVGRDCFALHAQGRTRVVAQGRRLEDVNACFEEVLAGDVPARLVFEM